MSKFENLKKDLWLKRLIFVISIGVAVKVSNSVIGINSVGLTADYSAFVKVLGVVMILALIVERFVEFFIADADSAEKAKLKSENVFIENALKAKDSSSMALINKKKSEKDQDIHDVIIDNSQRLSDLNSFRRQSVIPIAMSVGVLISISGIRFMEELLTIEPGSMGEWQKNYLIFIDIVLSGVLIGGGSDFVHELMKLLKPNKAN